MSTSAVMFPVGQDWYAVAAAAVREVVFDPTRTIVPTAPGSLLGVFNLRGEVVPMFDTAALLGVGTLNSTSVVVVVNTARGAAGLVASGAPMVGVVGAEVGPSQLRATLGVHVVDDRIVVMVDIDVLLAPSANVGEPTMADLASGTRA